MSKNIKKLMMNIMSLKCEKGRILENEFRRMSISELVKIRDYCSDMYYNSDNHEESVLIDTEYDLLESVILERQPGFKLSIGSEIRSKNSRVELPVYMHSLDKIKVNDVLRFNQIKNPRYKYVVQDKLDGVSCLLVWSRNMKMYTRGDGKVGSNITILSKYISSIPRTCSSDEVFIRGELIISKDEFKKFSKLDNYSNPRNMVSGLINSNKICESMRSIQFIPYEIISTSSRSQEPPLNQLVKLECMGFRVVDYEVFHELDFEKLPEKLSKRRLESEFGVDGLVIQSNTSYNRATERNPKYSLAFKHSFESDSRETNVLGVEWNVSKWGIIKPRIKLEPVIIDDVTISYTTGFNAKYIETNNIGSGTRVKLCRSGDVIPYIKSIVKSTKAEFPNIPYLWSKSGVDILVSGMGENSSFVSDEEKVFQTKAKIKQCLYFFQKIGVKHMNISTFEKLYIHGFDTICKILSLDEPENYSKLLDIKGFNKVSIDRMIQGILESRKNLTVENILAHSGVLGIGLGEKKIKLLLDNIKDIMDLETETDAQKSVFVSKIINVKGFSNLTAEKIIRNWSNCKKTVKELLPYRIDNVSRENVSDDRKLLIDVSGKRLVFTGFRDSELEKIIEKSGGVISTTVNSKSNYLVCKKNSTSSKFKKAKSLGIPILIYPTDICSS